MERRPEELEAVRRLCEAAIRGNVASLIELVDKNPFLLHRIIIHHCDKDTPLHVAVMLGHYEFANEILSRNQELALELDSEGCSPLHLASAKGYIAMVKMLLKYEPYRICILRDELGRTPLHIAAMKGRDEVLKELLSANTESARILTDERETVLHLAVKHNRLNTLKVLLAHEASNQLLNSKDEDGNTILHLAVARKQIETLKYLVGGSIVGLEINLQNENGSTPLDVLLQCESDLRVVKMAELLGDNMAVRGAAGQGKVITRKRTLKNSNREEDWVNDMRSSLMVVASLIATEAFEVGLSPPGGVWQQDDHQKGQGAGRSIMGSSQQFLYRQYLFFNSLSFLSSLSLILLLISGLPIRRKLYMWVLMVIMWIAVSSMALTYSISQVSVEPNHSPYENVINRTVPAWLFLMMFIVSSGNLFRLFLWLSKRRQQAKKTTVVNKDRYTTSSVLPLSSLQNISR